MSILNFASPIPQENLMDGPYFTDNIESQLINQELPPELKGISSDLPLSLNVATPSAPFVPNIVSEKFQGLIHIPQLVPVFMGDKNDNSTLDDIIFLSREEVQNTVLDSVMSDPIENIEESMNVLKNMYDQGTNNIKNDPDLMKAMMERANGVFEGVSDDVDMESLRTDDMDYLQRGGASTEFEIWEEQMMKCGFESFLVTALEYIWVPARLARQIAWYTAAFFRGVVGVVWGTVKALFKFVWSNKVDIILWLTSFANIMNMLKPLYTGPPSARSIIEKSWETTANINMAYVAKNQDRFLHIENRLNTGNVDYQDIVDELMSAGVESNEASTMINIYNSVKSVVGKFPKTSHDYSKIYSHFVDMAKWSEVNKGILPGEKIVLIGNLVEKYNYYLGGIVSDKVNVLENGVNDAIDIYNHGWVWPAIDWTDIDWTDVPMSDFLIPDELYEGPIKLPSVIGAMPVLSMMSLYNVMAITYFLIKAGPLVFDLGMKLWNEMFSINFTCASASQMGGGTISDKNKRIKEYLQEAFSKVS